MEWAIRRRFGIAAKMSTVPDNPAPPPLLEMRRVSIQLGGHEVLRNIDLAVPRGQTLVILGESGCGKTVLLKLLIGLLQPSSGHVIFDGRDLSTLGERDLTAQRLRFGFLFQGAALFDSLSVFDNVAFALRYQKKLTEAQIRERVRQRLQEVGLGAEVENKKPGELSGGMKKRVGLARALALDPEVLLYDEPTTGLDPIMSDTINELILQTRQKHPVTSIVVTHDMKTAYKVAERAVMLYPLGQLKPDEPQILYDGPPNGIADAADPRVRQFVRGEAKQEANQTPAAQAEANQHGAAT
jgi:phospholipid/cholesterol/gamma-HCH transport system ATP-binding protein